MEEKTKFKIKLDKCKKGIDLSIAFMLGFDIALLIALFKTGIFQPM